MARLARARNQRARDRNRRRAPAISCCCISAVRRRRRRRTLFSPRRGLILRAVGAYGLPQLSAAHGRHRRSEPSRRRRAARFRRPGQSEWLTILPDRLGPALGAPLFERAAIIGVGLIGSSLARVVRRKGLAAQDRRLRRIRRCARARRANSPSPTRSRRRRRGRRRRRSRHPLRAGRRDGRDRAPRSGRISSRGDRLRRRIGQKLDHRGGRAASAALPFISSRRIRSQAPSNPGRTRALLRCSSTAGRS